MSFSGEIMVKIAHYTEIPLEEVKELGAVKVKVRWLISKKDGAKNFAMRLFEVDEEGNTPLHTHPWEHEVYILEGEAKIIAEDREYLVKEGCLAYIPPNVKHSFINTGKGKLKFICVIPTV